MAEKRYIHIRNWDHFQHPDVTRNRRSAMPWIKDFTGQMSDEDWLALSYADRGLLQSLRLQYALRHGRGIDQTTTSLQRVTGQRTTKAQVERLNHAGFIYISASKVASDPASDVASLEVEGEVEGEVDLEEEKPNPTPPAANNGHDLPPELQPPPSKNGWGDGEQKGLEPIAQTAGDLIAQLRGAA